VQPRWYSQEVTGTVDGQVVSIKPTGFWRTTFAVEVDGRGSGTIATRTWGAMCITLMNPQGAPVGLEFVRKSFWGQGHVLRIGKDHELLELKPRMNWRTFSQEHLVTLRGTGIAPAQLNLVLALCGFTALLIRKRQAAAAA
jgi:hypothetical protein